MLPTALEGPLEQEDNELVERYHVSLYSAPIGGGDDALAQWRDYLARTRRIVERIPFYTGRRPSWPH